MFPEAVCNERDADAAGLGGGQPTEEFATSKVERRPAGGSKVCEWA
jgi:hypothetical protein